MTLERLQSPVSSLANYQTASLPNKIQLLGIKPLITAPLNALQSRGFTTSPTPKLSTRQEQIRATTLIARNLNPYLNSPSADTSPQSKLLLGLSYGSSKNAQLLGPANQGEAQKTYIAGYIPTPKLAGELRSAGLANAMSEPWQMQIKQAAERNGGLGNTADGFLAFSKNGFIRLKNENLTPEQNRRMAEMSLITGVHVEKLPARTTDSVADPSVNQWVDTVLARHDEALSNFLLKPESGYHVNDGRKRFVIEFNREAGTFISYDYRKHGGLRGMVEKNLKSISTITGWVSTVGSFIPGWGQVAAISSQALQFAANSIARGKIAFSEALSTLPGLIPGGGAMSRVARGLLSVGGEILEKGKLSASTLWSGISQIFSNRIPAAMRGLGGIAADYIDRGKLHVRGILNGIGESLLNKFTSGLANDPTVPTDLNGNDSGLWSNINKLAGRIWNLPNTALGMIWGGVGMLGGAKVRINNNAIEFLNHPLMLSGITIGDTISYAPDQFALDQSTGRIVQIAGPNTPEGNHMVKDHERQHIYQGETLGPMYLPAHLIEGLSSLLTAHDWHTNNDLEKGPMSDPPRPFIE